MKELNLFFFSVLIPKYARVNTLKTTVEEIIDIFRDDGWIFVRHFENNNYESFVDRVASLAPSEFMLDLHVKTLLIFPPKTEFHMYEIFKDGRISIQDKASCLPAILLNPPPGSTVLDMCAAPGMKTTQLAALMNNEGTLYAVELNNERFESLNNVVMKANATCVKTINADVIQLETRNYQDVEYILVDPSCSGSGIVERKDYSSEREIKTNLERISKLASFQIKILKTALHRYPKAKRIVYSTCSLYSQENEEVVREVLASSVKYTLVQARNYLTAPWNDYYGSSKFDDIGKNCLFSRPETDHTIGFFVAVFERLEDGEENPFGVIDLERKPMKRKGITNDLEFVSITHLGADSKKSVNGNGTLVQYSRIEKLKKKKNTLEHNNGMVEANDNVVCIEDEPLSENVMKVKDDSQKKHKKRKFSNESNIIEETIRTEKHKKKKSISDNNEIKAETSDNFSVKDESFSENVELKESSKKKNKKRKSDIENDIIEESFITKKHQKKNEMNTNKTGDVASIRDEPLSENAIEVEESSKKKSKKQKSVIENTEQNGIVKEKKKKKKEVTEAKIKIEADDVISLHDKSSHENVSTLEGNNKKKSKKLKDNNENGIVEESITSKKPKKKRNAPEINETYTESNDIVSIDDERLTEINVEKSNKKKSKKHNSNTENTSEDSRNNIEVEDVSIENKNLEMNDKKKKKKIAPSNESDIVEEKINIKKTQKKKCTSETVENNVETGDIVCIENELVDESLTKKKKKIKIKDTNQKNAQKS